LRCDIDPDLLEQLRELGKQERKEIGELIYAAADAFGQPHLHHGVGVRGLGHGIYECRRGLKTRQIFERMGNNNLYFHFMGDHAGVKRFLRDHG
jgi:mRNA-degrading endonuclease RelE of RelBE toxin-antitoxin system